MTILVAVWLFVTSAWAQPVPFLEVPRETFEKDDLARGAFRTGVEAFKAQDFSRAVENLKTVPELGGFLSLYTHWLMGQSLFIQQKWSEAIPHFNHVIDAPAASELKYQAQFFLAKIAIEQKKWGEAEQRLARLERKWRRSNNYPEVLYDLAGVELRRERSAQACKWAKKLFVKYPAYPPILPWSSLKDQKINDLKLPCSLTNKEIQDRARKLQLAGESEKARAELQALQAKASESERPALDLMMANFLVNEGLVEDALALLVRYHPSMKGNFNYLTLLGKAAARAGEYQTAVGAYDRAYKMSPRSRKGREALFQAAILSYQFQDYDDATRKFDQFIKQQPRSGLARDAQWHMAWLKYLRGDYRGALERFEITKRSLSSRKSSSESLAQRLAYWGAMAQLRLGQKVEAKRAFDGIFQRSPHSYYGLAAQARLTGLQDISFQGDRGPSSDSKPVEPATGAGAPGSGAVDASIPPALGKIASAPGKEEEESEENLSVASEAADEGDGGDSEGAEAGDEEVIQASDFKDPALRRRIEVAQSLIELGLPDLARWELWEVERRTRNSQYLKILISAYEGIGSFNRSSSISELNFERERSNSGLEGGRALWMAMYPQAYKSIVQKSASDAQISPETVWAIMRTESLYKPDVVSPVGARGLLQLMPFTARNVSRLSGQKELNPSDLFKPEVNIPLGSQYLARLGQKFKGSLPLVSAAYNAGPHRVQTWLVSFGNLDADEFIEHIPFMETRNYVKKVVRSETLYRRIYARDSKPPEFLARALGVPIPARPSARENWDAL